VVGIPVVPFVFTATPFGVEKKLLPLIQFMKNIGTFLREEACQQKETASHQSLHNSLLNTAQSAQYELFAFTGTACSEYKPD
jgi:hypothetical protein